MVPADDARVLSTLEDEDGAATDAAAMHAVTRPVVLAEPMSRLPSTPTAAPETFDVTPRI